MTEDRIRELIQKALDRHHEGRSADEVLADIEAGHAFPFYGKDSVLIATLHDEPAGLRAHGWVAAGKLSELMGTLGPFAIAWAREMGARLITIEGRRGWARVMKRRMGFEELSVKLGLKL